MILQCPACNARYAVPDHAIGANGRTVRCVKCAHQWFVGGVQAADVAALEELLKTPETPVAKPAPKGSNVPAPVGRPSLLLIGSLAASFLLAVVSTVLVKKPAWIGFRKTENIVLSNLSLAKQQIDTSTEYAISANLINNSNAIVVPPGVRITLVDKNGEPLKQWDRNSPPALDPQQAFPVSYGPLKTSFSTGHRLIVDVGNSLELMLRRKP